MNGRQMRETERNIRSEEFLTQNAADFSAIAVAAQMTADLTAKLAKVQQEYQRQIGGGDQMRHDYDIVKDSYDALLADMRSIRDFARSIARRIPGFEEFFRVPVGSGKRKLIAAARVFADNAEPRRQDFFDYGLDEDFITDLRAQAAALETALNEAAESTGERVGATDTLEIDVDAATDIVEAIDPIVRRVYRSNPTNLAAWTYASHVERHTPVPRPPKPPDA